MHILFLRPHLCKLIAQCGQTHLLIHEDSISHFGMFCIMRCCHKLKGVNGFAETGMCRCYDTGK